MKSKDDLRIGVIGIGGRGSLAEPAHKPGDGSCIVAAADSCKEALADAKRKYGASISCSTDYRRLLDRKDVDAVFVCTPDYLHEEQAIAVLESGKTLYLEKPLAITVKGCDRILDTARKTGTKLYLGHNMRHFPAIRKMKGLIDAGAIGRLQAVWCRHFIAYGGDAYFKDWH